MAAVKLGVSRQVVIPKKIHDRLGLAPGDSLEVELKKGRVVIVGKVDFRLPFFACLELDLPTYEETACPLCDEGVPLTATKARSVPISTTRY